MIRLTWRQFRVEAIIGAAALLAVTLLLALTGPHLAHLYDTTVAACTANGDCDAATSAFLRNDRTLRLWLGVLVVAVPGIVGIFWGAPLVARELEGSTFRLAWTQSVTRTRWLAVKLGAVGLASMAAAGLLSLAVTWWSSPFDKAAMNRFGSFDQRDIVPIGYAAFAFALGVTAGTLLRRTLPAMATTLVAFVAVRLAFNHWLRPQIIAPVTRVFALNPDSTGYGWAGNLGSLLFSSHQRALQPSPPHLPNAWIISMRIVDKAGHALTGKVLQADCPNIGSGGSGSAGGHTAVKAPAAVQQRLHDCVAKVGATYHLAVSYQPANRYWALQGLELAIFIGLALLLAGLCLWWVCRRLA